MSNIKNTTVRRLKKDTDLSRSLEMLALGAVYDHQCGNSEVRLQFLKPGSITQEVEILS